MPSKKNKSSETQSEASDGTVTATPRKPRTPSEFFAQRRFDRDVPLDSNIWEDLPGTTRMSAKDVAAAIAAQETAGTYRIVRKVAILEAKPRTGLQLDVIK